jgi:hypothetical protein
MTKITQSSSQEDDRIGLNESYAEELLLFLLLNMESEETKALFWSWWPCADKFTLG